MSNAICLNPDYSTTRVLINRDSLSNIKPGKNFESTRVSSSDSSQKIEGGLRTKGYFKTSFEDKPLISVVTVVFNGQEYLEETIKSVINQTYDNVEYIIIDGGSKDGTLQILRQYEMFWIIGLARKIMACMMPSTKDFLYAAAVFWHG
jgi:hypothetical protein